MTKAPETIHTGYDTRDRLTRSLQYIAYAGLVFAAILCVLILANYIQVRRTDPLNTPVLKVLNERLQTVPGDDQLRQQIRELDLLARKAFFTSQWQLRMGGYLLFFSILVSVACFTIIAMLGKIMPGIPPDEKMTSGSKISRKWLIYTGGTIVLVSLILIMLTHHDLGKEFEAARQSNMNAGMQEKTNAGMQEKTNAGMQEKTNAGMQGNEILDSADSGNSGKSLVSAGTDDFASPEEVARNFPSFRGPGANGIAYQKNIPTRWDGSTGKNIRWKTGIPLPGYNSPIVWNDRIFLAGASETKREVYCLDLESGKILWSRSVKSNGSSSSQVPKVSRETGYSAPTMTTDGRRVYAIFANGDVVALDFEGNQVWVKNLGMPQNHYGHSSSLVMYQDLLIVQLDQRSGGSVMALTGKTGKTAWQTARNVMISWASPVLVNTGKRMELMLAADPLVASYDPAGGKELWKMECISGEVGPSIAYADNVVFSINDNSKLSAIAISGAPALLWEDTEYLSDIPSPVATAKYLFVVTSFGDVVCYDAKSGKRYWVQELGTQVFASPILAEGKIFLLDRKGIMHIFKAGQAYSVISESPLGEASACTPAFAEGRIIIRGDKNLYCIGK